MAWKSIKTGVEILVRATLRTVLICAVLYGLYWLKSAAGINLATHYHAIDVFQQPVEVIVDIFAS